MPSVFTPEQQKLIRTLGFQGVFDSLTDDDFVRIEALVGDALVTRGLDANYNPTPIGEMCESILERLP